MEQNKQNKQDQQNTPQQDDQANYNPTARNFDQLDVSGEPQPISTETKTEDPEKQQEDRSGNESRH